MARFATSWTVDAFHTGVDGLVITPAGTDVPDDKVAAVQAAAAHNGVELRDATPAAQPAPATPPVTPVTTAPKIEEQA